MGDDDAPAPGTLLGRYVVDAVLGSGAMGVVVRAYDPELDRTVALKLWRASDPTDKAAANARLVREAQAMARLSHPNVVRVHDVGVALDRVFVALDLIEGGTLRSWLTTRRSLGEILTLLDGAGRGLAAAHELGLVHRDFKPDNILVDVDGRAHVTDFGLVRLGTPTRRLVRPSLAPLGEGTSEATARGTILGTPAYMAPEQLEGGEVDERSDQFAYCVTLWEAVYGARPFAGASVDRLASAVLRGELAAMPTDRDVPSWLRRVLLRGLSRHPGDRWGSMHDLLAALRHGAARRRRIAWVSAGVAAAGIAIAAGSWSSRAPCVEAARAHAATLATTEAALAAVLATPERSPMVVADAQRSADTWLAAWSRAHDEACSATADRGERSSAALASARSCLDEGHAELAAIVELAGAHEIDERAIGRALVRLPDPRVCTSEVIVGDTPNDLAGAQRTEVARLRAARSLRLDLDIAAPDDAPAALRLEHALDRAAKNRSTAAEAIASALLDAERVGSATARARAWIARVQQLADLGEATADISRSSSLAHAAIARAGDDAGWHADVDLAHGLALLAAERTDEALQRLRASAAARERRLGADHVALADTSLALARVHRAKGELEPALAEQLRALALVEAHHGPDEPYAAEIHLEIAATLGRMGDAEAATAQRARAASVLGPKAGTP